jgi:hypothetical protein
VNRLSSVERAAEQRCAQPTDRRAFRLLALGWPRGGEAVAEVAQLTTEDDALCREQKM